MPKTHIHVVKMGGTIEFFDPAYDAVNKRLMKLDSNIETYFHNLIQPHFTYSTESITEKDSRDITNKDRQRLAKTIIATNHDNILITHGTFTMQTTAKYLDTLDVGTKKIILTGSMIPLVGFSVSDAGFNLGFAVASYAHLTPGVYISMNGGIFKSTDVEKNVDIFRFE